jgi:hypothetical protein
LVDNLEYVVWQDLIFHIAYQRIDCRAIV